MKNNKGYMLVEIILASAIAFGLAFFIIDLIIKLKNKNDDLFIETLVNTDKTIIANKLMDYAIKEGDSFDCSKLVIDGNTIKYNGEQIDIVNKYTTVKEIENYCNKDGGLITINIPLEVKQMPDKEFDITLDYKYQIGDKVSPTCDMEVEGTTIKVSAIDEESGIKCSGWDDDCSTSLSGSSVSTTREITDVGDYVFSMEDNANNKGSCQIKIVQKYKKRTCSSCSRCSSAGCETYSTWDCGSYNSCSQINPHSSSYSTYSATECEECGTQGEWQLWHCKTCTRSCYTYYSNCGSCGCSTWSSWSDNNDSCTASSSVECESYFTAS